MARPEALSTLTSIEQPSGQSWGQATRAVRTLLEIPASSITPMSVSLQTSLCDIVNPGHYCRRITGAARLRQPLFDEVDMQYVRAFSSFVLATVLCFCAHVEAKLVKLEIAKREVVADGAAFGSAGPYEKLTGRAYFEVDPALERNKPVFDIDHAPLNASGKVEF